MFLIKIFLISLTLTISSCSGNKEQDNFDFSELKIRPKPKNNENLIIKKTTNTSKVKSNLIKVIHKYILKNLKPDLTFILKVSPKTSYRRLKKRKTKNRYDNFPKSFYKKAQNSFIKIAKNKKNYFILNSSFDDNLLEKKIFKITSKYLNLK